MQHARLCTGSEIMQTGEKSLNIAQLELLQEKQVNAGLRVEHRHCQPCELLSDTHLQTNRTPRNNAVSSCVLRERPAWPVRGCSAA